MSEWICRTLRDGGLEGEHAPALTINDTVNCPLGSFVFDHILSQLSSFIFSKKSQSSGIVLVALSRSPLYYEQLLKNKGFDAVSSSTWFKVLDCYTDPLGWKCKLVDSGSIGNAPLGSSVTVNLCKNIKDLDKLLSAILELGKEFSEDGKGRFVVAIDSVSEMLRHASVPSVASLLTDLRSNEQVSSMFWQLHADLHESRTTAALEYMSSIKATIESIVQLGDGQRGNLENRSLMEHNLTRGKFCVHAKRRNGRVRIMVLLPYTSFGNYPDTCILLICVNVLLWNTLALTMMSYFINLHDQFEEIYIDNLAVKFTSVSSAADEMTAQSLVPKVQFNLQLTEKERNDRAKVVLPFEHQGNGKTIEIYDGRKSLGEAKAEMQHTAAEKEESGRGEIIYFRDSDDEMPDSDEDPDDDLDI